MKKSYIILPAVLILYFLVGCQNKTAMTELETKKAQAERIKNAIHQIYAALNKNDLSALDEFYATDLLIHRPPYPNIEGLNGFKELYSKFFKAFPDAVFAVEEIIVEDNKAAIRMTCKGTHTGTTPTLGLPATGKPYMGPGSAIMHFTDDKITEQWEFWDELGFYQQLGYELKAASE